MMDCCVLLWWPDFMGGKSQDIPLTRVVRNGISTFNLIIKNTIFLCMDKAFAAFSFSYVQGAFPAPMIAGITKVLLANSREWKPLGTKLKDISSYFHCILGTVIHKRRSNIVIRFSLWSLLKHQQSKDLSFPFESYSDQCMLTVWMHPVYKQ